MRRAHVLALLVSPICLALNPFHASPAAAQERQIREAGLPAEVEARLLGVLDDPATTRRAGPATIAPGEAIPGALVVVGDLSLDGTVGGDVLVVDGALSFGSGARVGGDIFVVDGRLRGDVGAGIDGSVTVYGDAPDRDRADWADWADWDERDGRDGGGEDADASFVFRSGMTYNRVEGLPIAFGPRLRTGGANPLRLEALAIWRTEDDGFDSDELGYDVTLEQSLPHGFAVGTGVRSVVEPIERRGLGDTENGLATFLFHDDYRDYFERTGWSAFIRWHARSLPLRAGLTFRNEDHGALAAHDPWSLTDGDEPWRLQPLVGVGELRTLTGDVDFDTYRDDDRSGWSARLAATTGLGGELVLPERTMTIGPEGTLPPEPLDEDFLNALLDLRRYEPIGRRSQLALRAVVAGTPTRSPLPPQFQHALGGIGSLPGYAPFEADCAARIGTVTVGVGEEVSSFYPGYGCDRIALFQAEYRGSVELDLDFDWGPDSDWEDGDDRDGPDGGSQDRRADRELARRESKDWDDWGDWTWDDDWDPGWAIFFDAGQGWDVDGAATDTDVLYDAGVGLLLGDLGIYWAAPLTDDGSGSRFFIRLDRRF
ncbi:MAG: hypothetical protein ACRELV_05620 [Longimicrobiales bacterium]